MIKVRLSMSHKILHSILFLIVTININDSYSKIFYNTNSSS
ncbi:hypothetical protein NARC_130054 [Candidatus Nitrosocosmicus arcticus]|uniref:Uncharacterized protein n=1 Tax=Candidatus Nitrosocosmicus arcticus TaxID=2035267 RepID=A0A557SSY7_9ARCH|nr:hypothetical protein NARC_130054 [Candidatus Nitrosocosmicus arcticus]